MPTVVFVLLAFLLISGGVIALMRPAAEAELKRQSAVSEPANARIVDLTTFVATQPFEIRMPRSASGTPVANAVAAAVRLMRNHLIETRGIPDMPTIDFVYDQPVPENRVQFTMSEVPLIDVEMRFGWAAAVESLDRCLELGFEAREDVLEGSRRRRVWVRVDDERKLSAAGIRYLRWEDVFAADVQVEMLRNCAMFVGVHEIQRFQRWADRCYPELGKELGKAVPLLRLTEVLQRLTREGISLRNARLVLETILEWAPKERDSDMVADYVRLALKRQLCHEVARDGLIEAVLLSPELEDQIRNAIRQTPQGSYVDLNSETEQALLDQLSELSGTGGSPAIPPVLVTTADIRRSVRKLIEEEFFSVPVFSYSELTPHTRVQPVGMIEL